METLTLRPALASDLPTIAALDLEANPTHLIIAIPFANASDRQKTFLSRCTYQFNHPDYNLIISVSEEKIVGFLVWRKQEKILEWKPNLPEGTDLKFFGKFLPALEGNKKKFDPFECYEVERPAINPTYQRCDIGSLLLNKFLEEADESHTDCYLIGTAIGRPLYEKLGWKVVDEFKMDMTLF